MSDTTTISTPFTLGNGRVIKNRLIKSALSEQMGDADRNPGEGLANAYRMWSAGGCGTLISGNIMVDRQHIGEPKNVALDEQSDLNAFKRWAEAATSNGSEFWAQLNHPGKQIPKLLNSQPLAPSAVPLGAGLDKAFATPRAMTEAEITSTIAKFGTAARLAKEAGFTGVQIHGAHGYLVSQFLSPRANVRDDQWGGSLENRMRFVLEVYKAIRAEVGAEFPVGVKLNSADFMKGGFSEDDSMQVIEALAGANIDLIEISGGTYERPEMQNDKRHKQSTVQREAFFMDYAEKLRQRVDVPLLVTGGFHTTAGMNAALQSGAMDFIGLGRTMCVDPALPNNAMNDPNYSQSLPEITTGIKAVDVIAVHSINWYQQQIWRMGRNQQPNINMGAWASFGTTLKNMGKHAFNKQRA